VTKITNILYKGINIQHLHWLLLIKVQEINFGFIERQDAW